MDQIKTGKFILELRKEKEMTQKELAEKLGVTDRAVSKWENGRGMPDVSLMKPLCEILGITVSELLSGERIKKEEYQEKSEFRFLDTIEITEKKIKKKNTLLRIVLVASVMLLVGAWLLVYLLPVTRGFFRADEEIGFFYVHKTLPVCPDGEMPERYSPGEFVDQDITEKIDMERLKELLPLMRVSVYQEQGGRHWVGDVTYEIFGYFRSGPRAGKTFTIYLGDWNYLMHHAAPREHIIVNSEIWMEIIEDLEGWEEDYRETFQWEEPRTFSIHYLGACYSGQGQLLELPEDAEYLFSVSGISSHPDEAWECSFGTQGNGIYTWTQDGQTYLAVQVAYDQAYGIPLPDA